MSSNRGKKLSSNIVEQMQFLADKGTTLKQASEIMNVPYATMKSRARTAGIKFSKSNPGWTKEKVSKLLEMAQDGITAADAAKELGITKARLLTVASQQGISFAKGFKKRKNNKAEENKNLLLDLASKGLTLQEAADEVGISYKGMLSRSLRAGVKFKRSDGSGHGTSEGALKAWKKRSKEELSQVMKKYWSNEENRELQSSRIKKVHKRPDYIEKRIKFMKTKTSSLEKVFKRILIEDLKLEEGKDFEHQFKLGHYAIDFMIKRSDKKDLLIELNGDYWHSLKSNINKDKSKTGYINNYYLDNYELKIIWEHEFIAKDRIVDLLRFWLDKIPMKQVNFKELEFKLIDKKEAKKFLEKYHYYSNLGGGGNYYGALYDGLLICVAVFSSPHRQNLAEKFNIFDQELLELSRLAIRRDFHVKNLASWFISKCVKQIRHQYPKIKMLLSYSDLTYNHDGTVYKASNWEIDGHVAPDYWYSDEDGYVIKKQSAYKHARKMNLTEKEFVEKRKLIKVWGKQKIRFIKWLDDKARIAYELLKKSKN